MKKLFLALALCTGVGLNTSCVKQPVHAGAVNPVDSQLYDALLTAQSSITAAKEQVTALPRLKAPLNNIITVYNQVWKDYAAYHNALVAGTAMPGDDKKLLVQVQAILASLTTALTEAKK